MSRREHEVILFYDQEFKKLDCLFAADVVSGGTSDVDGPFEAAKTRFLRDRWYWFVQVGLEGSKRTTKLSSQTLPGRPQQKGSGPKNVIFQMVPKLIFSGL